MAMGWAGELARLVPLDKSRHLENAVGWLNDEETTRWLLIDAPVSRVYEEEFFDRVARGSDGQDAVFAIETLDGQHIGFAGAHHIAWPHGHAETGMFIGPADVRGKGFGTDAMRVRTRWAFEVYGLRLLYSRPFAENAASIRALERVGYRRVGTWPKFFWKRGAFRDVALMALDQESWRASLGDSEAGEPGGQ